MLLSESTHPREAKERLAREIVAAYCNENSAESAAQEFKRVFSGKELPEDIPVVEVGPDQLEDGKIWIVKLVTTLGLASSSSEARRLVTQGGVYVDGRRTNNVDAQIPLTDGLILQVGRRKFARVKLI